MTFNQLLFVATCLATAGVPAAFAQGAAPRPPSGGLFAATRPEVPERDKLDLTMKVAQGLESSVPVGINSPASSGLESGGLSTLFQAASEYARHGPRLDLRGQASTALKYYRDLDRLDPLSHNAAVSGRIRVPNGTVRLEQGVAYSPSYLYQLFPIESSAIEGAIPTNPEYQIVATDSYSYRTTTGLELGSASGTRFSATGNFNRTNFSDEAVARSDHASVDAGVNVARRLSRSKLFDIGYRWRATEYAVDKTSTEHRATVGVEYSPALSRTRRAAFRLAVMPSWLAGSELVPDIVTGPVESRVFYVGAEASVSFPFRPSWQVAGRYRRSVENLAIFNEPLLTDAARIELTGLLARRVDLSVSGGYAEAARTFDGSAQRLDSYTGHLQVRYALKRGLALSSEYLYYFYDQGRGAALSTGLPTLFEQHSVRFGVVLLVAVRGR